MVTNLKPQREKVEPATEAIQAEERGGGTRGSSGRQRRGRGSGRWAARWRWRGCWARWRAPTWAARWRGRSRRASRLSLRSCWLHSVDLASSLCSPLIYSFLTVNFLSTKYGKENLGEENSSSCGTKTYPDALNHSCHCKHLNICIKSMI